MVYLVTRQQNLFKDSDYVCITPEQSLRLMDSWKRIQVDTETSGRDAHLCKLLCIQFGNDKADARIVVDTTTVDVCLYKKLLEERVLILQNGKFDLQFLYNYGIVPMHVYDTMIIEQLLYLGYPSGQISFSLKEIAWRRLNINIDKTVRGEIIWRGLDKSVIMYAAGDVTYLEQIMESQIKDLREKELLKAAKIECDFVPVMAYLEWCGIHLDKDKWKAKMKKDKENLEKAREALDNFVITSPKLQKYTYVNNQGDLFSGFNLKPQCTINWSSSRQVVGVAKDLGFDTKVQDKKTGEDKESVLEKHLKKQKGINDEFLKLYFDYQEHFKVVSSFGQGHLNAINPKTDRIHTVYRQLGAASGRMSCGSQQGNTDLAKLNGVKASDCTYPNMQQLPHDAETRACFTAPEGYLWSSCDFSALESRLGADIYNERSMLDEFLHGSGDMHSLCAYMVYKDDIPRDTPIKDIKKKYPNLRSAVKPIEFSQQFGGSEFAIQNSMGCTIEEAREFKNAYDSGFPGISEFKKKGSEFVRKNGYILMCKYSGHKMFWWDHDEWIKRQSNFNQDFWEEYRDKHKNTGDRIALEVKHHFQAAAKWDRMALNAPTQGSGIVILKIAMTNFFKWIIEKGYFGKVELSALVHDESNIIFPEELKDIVPPMQQKCMEEAAALVCKKLPIPAPYDVEHFWKH